MRATHLTASRIGSYKNCNFKYFLEYHLMYPPMKTGNIYAEKGSAVHIALEKWTNAKLGLQENAEEDYEKTLREYYAEIGVWKLDNRAPGKGHPHPVEKTCESCPWATKSDRCEISNKLILDTSGCPRPNFSEDLELVKKTLSRTDYNPLEIVDGEFVKKILGVEVSFDMELGGVQVRGKMDLVFEHNSETLEVCDYKTGRAMSFNKASKDAQVRTYGAIARILFPQYKYILVTLHYLKFNPVTVPLCAEQDKLTIKSLQKNFKEISQNNKPRPYKIWLCNYCVGYETCNKIYNNLKTNGRFRLPTIECNYDNLDTKCWGSIYPEKTQIVGPNDVAEIMYVCKGHAEMYTSGEYVVER